MEPLQISFTQRTLGDKEIAALEIVVQVLEYYKLNSVEKTRILEYLLSREQSVQVSDTTEAQ